MGNTASCRAGTVVNARQARGAHAETLMIPTHASTAIRSLVHAIGYGDLKNIAQVCWAFRDAVMRIAN